MLSAQQQSGIRQYMMNVAITLGQQAQKDKATSDILSRANAIIVQIVKHEWTTTWRDFVPQICRASHTDQNLCVNNLAILKILSEEVTP